MSAGPIGGSYDVVVVGAGVIGLASAWRAAQRGLSVVALDREALGSGASGVAAGMIAPVTEADWGEQGLLHANLDSAEQWPAFARELAGCSGLDTSYRQSGALVLAADRDDVEELRRLHEFQRSLELDVEWLSGRECRQLEPGLSPRVAGGVLAPGDHRVDPSALVRALGAALRRAGGEIVAPLTVESLELEGGHVTGVRTGAGTIRADQVVVAAGAWSGGLAAQTLGARPPVRPVKGQILTLRGSAAQPLAERVIRTPRCYVVCRDDGSVVIGATVEERGFDTRVTGEGVYRLLEAAWEVLPDVGELEWVGARAGSRPGTPDNAPVVGRGAAAGLIWATGHYRHGILLAPLTAGLVAALLAGEDPEAPAGFSPERFEARRLAGRVSG